MSELKATEAAISSDLNRIMSIIYAVEVNPKQDYRKEIETVDRMIDILQNVKEKIKQLPQG